MSRQSDLPAFIAAIRPRPLPPNPSSPASTPSSTRHPPPERTAEQQPEKRAAPSSHSPRPTPLQTAQKSSNEPPQPSTAPSNNDSDPQWSTTCRTCLRTFESRNQLMRHLFRAHPGRRKKDKKKTNPEITMTGGVGVGPYPPHRPELNPAPSGATTLETSRGASMGKSSGFNPLSLLSQEQMTVFVMRVFAVLVVVGMREMQSEKEREVDTGRSCLRDGQEQNCLFGRGIKTHSNTLLGSSSHGRTESELDGQERRHKGLRGGKQAEGSGEEGDSDEDGGCAVIPEACVHRRLETTVLPMSMPEEGLVEDLD